MRIKGILFKEMSDKGVKRYSVSLMIRDIQVEMRVFFLTYQIGMMVRI